MENLSLRKIQTTILNNIILVIAIVAIPAVLGSISRVYTIGWQPIFFLHIVLATGVILISFFRNKLSYLFKVYFILCLFFLLGVGAGMNLGLNGFFLEFLTVLIFLTVVFLAGKKVYLVYFVSVAAIIVIGYLHVTGALKPEGFKDEYSTFTSSWVNAAFSFSTIVAFVIYIAGQIGYVLQESNKKLQVAANTDYLTQCINRMGFVNIGNMEVEKAKRYMQKLSAIAIDIDHFKYVNDKYGHSTGDEVLRAIAFLLKENVRSSDILARTGGEEFMILVSNVSMEQTSLFAEKLRELVEQYKIKGIKENITISLGVTKYHKKDTLQTLMEKADAALYEAKQSGRNRVKLYKKKHVFEDIRDLQK